MIGGSKEEGGEKYGNEGGKLGQIVASLGRTVGVAEGRGSGRRLKKWSEVFRINLAMGSWGVLEQGGHLFVFEVSCGIKRCT